MRPAVHLATLDPVKVVGAGFAAGERVTVRVFPFGSASFSKVVTVKSTGRFVALFTARAIDECKGYRITAVGDEGHRASTRHIPPPCGVETIP